MTDVMKNRLDAAAELRHDDDDKPRSQNTLRDTFSYTFDIGRRDNELQGDRPQSSLRARLAQDDERGQYAAPGPGPFYDELARVLAGQLTVTLADGSVVSRTSEGGISIRTGSVRERMDRVDAPADVTPSLSPNLTPNLAPAVAPALPSLTPEQEANLTPAQRAQARAEREVFQPKPQPSARPNARTERAPNALDTNIKNPWEQSK